MRAFNDLVAMGLLSGLHERGIDVPGDISVTGFDDIPFATYTTPPLTTAAVAINDIGEQAWHELRQLLGDGDPEPAHTTFQPELKRRGSTGRVKKPTLS